MLAEDIAAIIIAFLIIALWSATYAFAAGFWSKAAKFGAKVIAFIAAEETAHTVIRHVVDVNYIETINGTVVKNESLYA